MDAGISWIRTMLSRWRSPDFSPMLQYCSVLAVCLIVVSWQQRLGSSDIQKGSLLSCQARGDLQFLR